MKKLISVLLMCAISVLLAVPCFAANTAKFNINVVSESNREIEISIDYEGGTAFACYDFEMEYNAEKLKVSSAIEGNGWDSFAKNTKLNGGAVISTINSNGDPIKGTCATTEPFKVVNGKDLVVVKFIKQTKDKINASDIKLKFTNCQTSDFQNIKVSVTNSLATAVSDTDAGTSAEKKTEENNTAKTDKSESTDKNILTSEEQVTDIENTVGESETVSELSEQNEENINGNSKKIVVVASAAVCMLFIIVGVCAYVAKKAKNDAE